MSRATLLLVVLLTSCGRPAEEPTEPAAPTCADLSFDDPDTESCVWEWYADPGRWHIGDVLRWALRRDDPVHQVRTPRIAAWLERVHRCYGNNPYRESIEHYLAGAGYWGASRYIAAQPYAPDDTCGLPPADAVVACDPMPEDAVWWHQELCAAQWTKDPARSTDLVVLLEAHPLWLIDQRFGDAAVELAACGPEELRPRAKALVDAILPPEVAAETPVSCLPP